MPMYVWFWICINQNVCICVCIGQCGVCRMLVQIVDESRPVCLLCRCCLHSWCGRIVGNGCVCKKCDAKTQQAGTFVRCSLCIKWRRVEKDVWGPTKFTCEMVMGMQCSKKCDGPCQNFGYMTSRRGKDDRIVVCACPVRRTHPYWYFVWMDNEGLWSLFCKEM